MTDDLFQQKCGLCKHMQAEIESLVYATGDWPGVWDQVDRFAKAGIDSGFCRLTPDIKVVPTTHWCAQFQHDSTKDT